MNVEAPTSARRVTSLIVITFLTRFAYIYIVTDWFQLTETQSSSWYFDNAISLATGRGFVLTALWMPLYSIALVPVYWLFGPSLLAARSINAFLSVGTVILLMRLARQAGGPAAGLAAGWIYAVFPTAIIYSGYLAAENLFVPLIIGLMLLFVRAAENPSWPNVLGIGVLLGLALLTRSEVAVFGAMGMLWLVVVTKGRRGPTIAKLAAAASVTVLLLTPWIVRNYLVFGRFVPLTTSSGRTLLDGNNDFAIGFDSWDHQKEIATDAFSSPDPLREPEDDARVRHMAVAWIESHPRRFAELALLKMRGLWYPYTKYVLRDDTPADAGWQRYVPVCAILSIFVAGWVGIIWARRSPARTVTVLVLSSYHLMAAVFFAEDRYRLPLVIVWIAFAAIAIVDWKRIASEATRFSGHGWMRAAALGLVLIVMASSWTSVMSRVARRVMSGITRVITH